MTTKDVRELRLECIRQSINKNSNRDMSVILDEAVQIYGFVEDGTTGKQKDKRTTQPVVRVTAGTILDLEASDGGIEQWEYDGDRMIRVPKPY